LDISYFLDANQSRDVENELNLYLYRTLSYGLHLMFPSGFQQAEASTITSALDLLTHRPLMKTERLVSLLDHMSSILDRQSSLISFKLKKLIIA
jgi:hypothetical protein